MSQSELRAERGDVADDGDRRSADLLLGGERGDLAQRAADRALVLERAALDHRRRLRRGPPGRDEPLGDLGQLAHAHVEDERSRERRERRPVDLRLRLRGILVAGDERDGARHPALRDRDSGVGRRRDPGSDPGHDLERDPVLAAGERLLAAAPEDERVAALEADDLAARERVLDDQRRSCAPAAPARRRRSCRRRPARRPRARGPGRRPGSDGRRGSRRRGRSARRRAASAAPGRRGRRRRGTRVRGPSREVLARRPRAHLAASPPSGPAPRPLPPIAAARRPRGRAPRDRRSRSSSACRAPTPRRRCGRRTRSASSTAPRASRARRRACGSRRRGRRRAPARPAGRRASPGRRASAPRRARARRRRGP